MILFHNVKVENGVFTAIAEDLTTGYKEEVVAKVDGSYHSSNYRDFVKATWNVVIRAERNGNKYEREEAVSWG